MICFKRIFCEFQVSPRLISIDIFKIKINLAMSSKTESNGFAFWKLYGIILIGFFVGKAVKLWDKGIIYITHEMK